MSDAPDKDQQTEEPTAKRLSDARERGELPLSQEVVSWGMLTAILVVVSFLGPPMARDMLDSLRVFIEKPEQIDLTGPGFQTALLEVSLGIGLATGLVFLCLLLAPILSTMLQTGFYMSTVRLKPSFAPLNIITNIKNMFSANMVAETLKSIVKMLVLGVVGYYLFAPMVRELPAYVGHSLVEVMRVMHDETIHLMVVFLVIVTLMAVADLVYQRVSYIKRLKMSMQEVKDEFKQMEGDPMIRNRLKQMRFEKARRRMLAQVPNASVIITNPTHYAVALKYDGMKMMAPAVIAKGVDAVALRIREEAEKHNIPMVSNPPLARALHDTVGLDEPIQPEQYRAVAEVISYVYKLKKKVIR